MQQGRIMRRLHPTRKGAIWTCTAASGCVSLQPPGPPGAAVVRVPAFHALRTRLADFPIPAGGFWRSCPAGPRTGLLPDPRNGILVSRRRRAKGRCKEKHHAKNDYERSKVGSTNHTGGSPMTAVRQIANSRALLMALAVATLGMVVLPIADAQTREYFISVAANSPNTENHPFAFTYAFGHHPDSGAAATGEAIRACNASPAPRFLWTVI